MAIRINFFKDDLTVALLKFTGKEVTLKDSNINQIVFKYLQKKLKFKPPNKKLIKYKVTGNRMDETFAIFEFEASEVQSLSKLKISNLIMQEVFSNQSNVVNVYEDTSHQILFFNKDKTIAKLN